MLQNHGLVQTFGIHIENLVIATLTTFVICMSDYSHLVLNAPNGIEITLFSFKQGIGSLGPISIVFIISLFALSTVISSYYYGESSLKFIKKTNRVDIVILKIVTLVCILVGSIISSNIIWIFVDVSVGIIAIINTYALFSLRGIVYEEYKYNKN